MSDSSESITDRCKVRDSVHIFSEFEDPVRQGYIAEIIAKEPTLKKINRGNLFHLWFADVDVLQAFAARATSDECASYLLGTLRWKASRVEDRLTVMAKSGSVEEPAGVEPNGDEALARETLARDGNKCVLTKHGEPGIEVAHIVAFKVHRTACEWANFHETQQFFWKQRAGAWRKALLDEDRCFNTERPSNLITLNSLVYKYWNNCQCAFRPIQVAEDGLSMDVSFHWLPPVTGHRNDRVRIDDNPYGASAEQALRRSPGQNLKVFNCETEEVVESGDIFTITTTDKEKYPLPSFWLLDLLWVFKRIAAMRGAEEEEVKYDGDVEYDEDSVPVSSLSRSPSSVISLDE